MWACLPAPAALLHRTTQALHWASLSCQFWLTRSLLHYFITHTHTPTRPHTQYQLHVNSAFLLHTCALDVSQFRKKQEVMTGLWGCRGLWMRGTIQLLISHCRSHAPLQPCTSHLCLFLPTPSHGLSSIYLPLHFYTYLKKDTTMIWGLHQRQSRGLKMARGAGKRG